MPIYEYKVVPAPTKGKKAKGLRGADIRFAFAFEELLNDMSVDGWEYLRAETLPCDERQGLTSVTTTYRTLAVFRRLAVDMPLVAESTPDTETARVPQKEEADRASHLVTPTATLLNERAAGTKNHDDDAPPVATRDAPK